MAYRKIDASVDEEMRALRKSGMLDRDIADLVGVSVDTVRNRIGKNPVEPNKLGRKSKVSDEEILALLDKGMSRKEIAQTLNITYETVRTRVNKLLVGSLLTPPPEVEPEKSEKPVEKPEKVKKVVEKPVEEPIPVQNTPAPVTLPPPPAPRPATQPHYTAINAPVIETELRNFAFMYQWTEQIYQLSRIANLEPWGFTEPTATNLKYPEVQILGQHIRVTFNRLAKAYNEAPPEELDKIIYIRENLCVFHTGLYTSHQSGFKGIYAVLTPNSNPYSVEPWFFKGFKDENAPDLARVHPMPEPYLVTRQKAATFDPQRELRINTGHIIENPKNVERLPAMMLDYWNGAMLLETAIKTAQRLASVSPQIVVPAHDLESARFLLPIYITNPDTPDLAAFLEDMGGYYHCRTLLTLEQAYSTARLTGRPTADWLRALVERR